MSTIYEWLNSLMALDLEIQDLKISYMLNEKEMSRWKNYKSHDGDLAQQQTFLVSLEKQAKLEGVNCDLNDRIKKLEEERAMIVEAIDKFKGLNNQILKMKYVDGMTLESIANELGYSYQYIKNKHSEIKRMISFTHKV